MSNNCTHENYEPMEVSGGFGGLFDLFDGGNAPVTVAHLCTDCREQLPVWWGCEDCETVEAYRKVSDAAPRVMLARPCQRHREAM